MNVVAFEVEDWEAGAFHELAGAFSVRTTEDPLDEDQAEAYRDAEVITTFIGSDLSASVLARLPKLKLIATRSTGVDHVDLGYCREHGITVCNVPRYGANTVAEHVFGLLLTLSHRLDEAINRTRKGDFSSRGLEGFDLKGRTMGVVGTGDIGRETIRIAKGFGMQVLAYDTAPDEDAAADLGFVYRSLPDLLAGSDVVSLHVPANEKTRHLIGQEEFELMRTGAVLINTARGEVLDIRAMVRALAEGKLGAAGLDVLPEEPVIREEAELLRSVYEREHNLETLLANHVVSHLRNVVVTPHSAFNTREAVQRILDTTMSNIEGFAQGDRIHVVNPGAN